MTADTTPKRPFWPPPSYWPLLAVPFVTAVLVLAVFICWVLSRPHLPDAAELQTAGYTKSTTDVSTRGDNGRPLTSDVLAPLVLTQSYQLIGPQELPDSHTLKEVASRLMESPSFEALRDTKQFQAWSPKQGDDGRLTAFTDLATGKLALVTYSLGEDRMFYLGPHDLTGKRLASTELRKLLTKAAQGRPSGKLVLVTADDIQLTGWIGLPGFG